MLTQRARALPVLLLAACSGPVGLDDGADEGFTSAGGVRLHYVIDFPAGEGPHPAAIYVHGSGRKTIQDDADIARRLVDRGIAMLRYDKRGTGQSGGSFTPSNDPRVNDALPDEYAPDAAAVLDVLAAHPRIDPNRVGMIGESQAGWTIPAAMRLTDRARFVVLKSGPTLPLGDVGGYEDIAAQRPDLSPQEVMAELERQGRRTGWGFDPTPHLEALEVPGLWVYGEQDRHVPALASARALEVIRQASGGDLSTLSYPKGDHGLRDVDSGEGIPYWEDVVAWLETKGFVR
ncbi:MAG: prolyl oligopeptidase family serine peptidase [Gemmatimonadota bacterium]